MFESSSSKKIMAISEVDSSVWKIIVIVIFGIVSSLGISYLLKNLIDGNDGANLILVLAAGAAFSIIALFQAMFIKSKSINLTLTAVESLGLTLFFIGNLQFYPLIIAWLAAIIFLWIAIDGGRSALKNQMKIKFREIARVAVPRTITAAALFASIVYAGSLYFNADSKIIDEKQLNTLIGPSDSLISAIMPKSLNFNQTAEQMALNFLMSSLGPEQKSLIDQSPSLKTQLQNQAAKSIQDLNKQLGTSMSSKSTVTNAVSNFISQKINQLPLSVKPLIYIAFGLLIFLTIKGTFALIHWLIYLLAYLIYEILIAVGFISISLESASKESVVL